MIEVLVTVLVMAIGLLGLAGMQGVSVRNNHSAYLRTQATHFASEIIDAMRANVLAAQGGGYDIGFADAPSSSDEIAENDLVDWRTNIAMLPSGTSSIARTGLVITVSVRWDDSRGGEAPEIFSMDTRL